VIEMLAITDRLWPDGTRTRETDVEEGRGFFGWQLNAAAEQ
jgi:hypothetical protein